MNATRRIGAAAVLWLCCGMLHAGEPTGRPPVSEFRHDLPVYPQNFDLAQDREGQIYIANNQGVISFDGERWALIELPNHDIARSLAYDGAQRVYVGGYNAFGYVERDGTGTDRYHDLTPLYAGLLRGESFADIWEVHLTAQGVFFRGLRHVFQYEPRSGQVALWRHEGRFGAMVESGRDLVLQFRGEGLKRLQGSAWELLPGSEPMQLLIYQLIALPGGGLIGLESGGEWRVYRDGAVRPYPMPAGLPESSAFDRALALPDGTLVLNSNEGELYIVDLRKQTTRSFRVDTNRLSGLVRARDGGLLSASGQGFFHIAWPARWSVLGDAEMGLTAGVSRMVRWGERWLALTGFGVFELDQPGALHQRFRRHEWSDAEAWDLLPLDSRRALLAESYAVILVEDGRTRPITPPSTYPRVFLASRFDPGRIYVGTEAGLSMLLEPASGQWVQHLREGDTPDTLVSTLVETASGEVWLGTERLGIVRVRLSPDGTKVLEARAFDGKDGIVYGRVAAAAVALEPDGTLIGTTNAGIFRWTGERFERDRHDGLAPMLGKDEWVLLKTAPNGDRWAWSYSHAWRRTGDGPWQREDLGSILPGALQELTFTSSGAALFAADKQVLRFDPSPPEGPGRTPAIRLRGVELLHPGGGRDAIPIQPGGRVVMREGLGLSFWFALPEYRRAGVARYQVRLLGLSSQYTEWSAASSYSYLHLQPGSYRFQARGRDAQGQVTQIESFELLVEPHWYRTGWARMLAAAAVFGAIFLLIVLAARTRTRRLLAEKERLETMVAERTRELESANRQLEAMAHLDGLLEIPNRRRLDDYLDQVWAQCADHHRPMSVVVIDVDRFKDYNDTHGHLAGDEVLKEMVQSLSSCLRRAEDLVARYGGDEFVAVLPGAELDVARAIGEAMRSKVEASDIGTTVSVGVASRRPARNQAVSDLIEAADGALYEAKRTGRNRVVVAPEA